MRAVLDANVVVSALIRPGGPPGKILARLLRDQEFELVASSATLAELERALRYPKVRKTLPASHRDAGFLVSALRMVAIVVEGRPVGRVVAADPADDVYIAAAVDGLAEYIVSGDRHLLELEEYEGIRIVRPREFLGLLDRSRPTGRRPSS